MVLRTSLLPFSVSGLSGFLCVGGTVGRPITNAVCRIARNIGRCVASSDMCRIGKMCRCVGFQGVSGGEEGTHYERSLERSIMGRMNILDAAAASTEKGRSKLIRDAEKQTCEEQTLTQPKQWISSGVPDGWGRKHKSRRIQTCTI